MVTTLPMLGWMQSLSDMTRARLLRLLERDELTVAELCAVVQCPQSTVSRHLKVLADVGWIRSRREGTSRYYQLALDQLQPPQRRLWSLVREQTTAHPAAQQDDQRLEQVLADRLSRSQEFFSSAAGRWDRLRRDLFGHRLDLWILAALLDSSAVVGELGCGTAVLSELLAPFARQVIAVDNSPAMLEAAAARLNGCANIDLRHGELTATPLDDDSLDMALLVLVLPYVAQPQAVLDEVARVLKPGGKLVVADIQPHDRAEYRQELGHLRLGVNQDQLTQWLEGSGFSANRWFPLPADPDARGPALFVATAQLQS